MRALYEIDKEIIACTDLETGEIIDQTKLDALQMERERKLENVALWVKDLRAEAEAIGNEVQALNARKKAAERKAEALKTWLGEALAGEVFKTPKVRISYTHNSRLNVTDEKAAIEYIEKTFADPEAYLKYQTPEIRKEPTP